MEDYSNLFYEDDIEDLDFISFEDLKDYEFNFNNDFCDDFDCFCCSYKDDCEYAMFWFLGGVI